jgi:hypothetical protein
METNLLAFKYPEEGTLMGTVALSQLRGNDTRTSFFNANAPFNSKKIIFLENRVAR